MPPFIIEEVPEIEDDLKTIRVTGFNQDYQTFKQALPIMAEERNFHRTHGLFPISGLSVEGEVYKAKKIKSKSLGRNDKFRVIFWIHNDKILILEVYYKGQKGSEDKDRIRRYCT